MAIGDGFTGPPHGVARAVVALLAAEAVYRVAVRSHVRRAIGITLHDELVAPLMPERPGHMASQLAGTAQRGSSSPLR
jgi:hypothetical protein